MTDLRLAAAEDGSKLDLVLEGNDLALDLTLVTPSLASLFTDARAALEDELPGRDDDRRGWWAEALLPGEEAELFGSKLWLLERAKLTNDTLGSAEVYAREAFAWLLERGIVERVDAVASRLDVYAMLLEVTLVRGNATARPELWDETAKLSLTLGRTRFQLLAIP